MHKFDREAMNTTFDLLITKEVDYPTASSAAAEVFDQTERLETLLSMYYEGSDIQMINTAEIGVPVKLTCYACDCIMAAFAASTISGGAIDVCLAELYHTKKHPEYKMSHPPRRGKFEIDPENFYIMKTADGAIDLGCIGKGFALDVACEYLKDVWQIENAFGSFGASSIFAMGVNDENNAWEINLSEKISIELPKTQMFIGASGTSVLGNHIIDARTLESPSEQPFRTWAFCDSGALSDAMSTAFMIMDRKSIEKACQENEIAAAIQKTADSEIEFINTDALNLKIINKSI